jgi:hypothetical protein
MGERFGGVGPGLTPNGALNLGLKVDWSHPLEVDTDDGLI